VLSESDGTKKIKYPQAIPKRPSSDISGMQIITIVNMNRDCQSVCHIVGLNLAKSKINVSRRYLFIFFFLMSLHSVFYACFPVLLMSNIRINVLEIAQVTWRYLVSYFL